VKRPEEPKPESPCAPGGCANRGTFRDRGEDSRGHSPSPAGRYPANVYLSGVVIGNETARPGICRAWVCGGLERPPAEASAPPMPQSTTKGNPDARNFRDWAPHTWKTCRAAWMRAIGLAARDRAAERISLARSVRPNHSRAFWATTHARLAGAEGSHPGEEPRVSRTKAPGASQAPGAWVAVRARGLREGGGAAATARVRASAGGGGRSDYARPTQR